LVGIADVDLAPAEPSIVFAPGGHNRRNAAPLEGEAEVREADR
jgi:hypothetical protein